MTSSAYRPRVAFLDHVARLSGGEIALTRLLTALDDDIEAHVILAEDGELVEMLEATGAMVEVIPLDKSTLETRKDSLGSGLPIRSAVTTAAYSIKLARRLRQLDPDIVHTNSLKAALYGGVAGRLAGKPVVWHIRDRISDDYLPHRAVTVVRRLARILPMTVIANSTETLSTIGVRGTVVPNAVVRDVVARPNRGQPHVAGRNIRIGMVGRLAPWKGQDVFLHAFTQAFKGEPVEARIIGSPMFGEDDYAESLMQLSESLGIAGQVEWRGFQQNIWDELDQLDVLVHCSVTPEPFGQVVVEGMAAGVPVIASAAGGPTEVIIHDVNGLLTKPGDVDDLARAMTRLVNDSELRLRLRTNGMRRAEDFRPEQSAQQMLEIYRGLLRPR